MFFGSCNVELIEEVFGEEKEAESIRDHLQDMLQRFEEFEAKLIKKRDEILAFPSSSRNFMTVMRNTDWTEGNLKYEELIKEMQQGCPEN
jgi:Asp-tRNA(Asn)/Glu-tRNA(Gln) amidotransferase C subunit